MSNQSAEVTAIVHAFAECWNRHDMNSFAKLFSEDAEFVNVVGLWWKGREEIRRAHEFTHATMFKNSHLTIADVKVRFPVENIAIARAGPVKPVSGLPTAIDAHTTAAWMRHALAGETPIPHPLVNQLACCLYACGYTDDMNQAKAIAAVEAGSLAHSGRRRTATGRPVGAATR